MSQARREANEARRVVARGEARGGAKIHTEGRRMTLSED